MKKALVISLGSRGTVENYGAVLQILAFCELLESRYNIQPEILDYIGVNCKDYSDSSFFSDNIFGKTPKEKLKRLLFGKQIENRFKRNIAFIAKERKVTDLYDYKSINEASFDYDYYIAESDVIWDPTFRNGGFDEVFFLDKMAFASGKRYVYSAGMGDCRFSEEDKKKFLKYISNLDAWSIREGYGKEYLKGFIECDPIVTLDPTLLVGLDFYNSFISDCKKIKGKYILVYTPGYKNKKMIEDAYEYAVSNGYKIICVSRVPIIYKKFRNIVNAGIEDFLSLLLGCEALFCDSFHGVCLSIELKKEFFVYERADGRKISDLCVRLGLEDRIVSDLVPKSCINYEMVYDNLTEERNRSFEFIDSFF